MIRFKRIISTILISVLFLSFFGPVQTSASKNYINEVEEAIERASEYMLEKGVFSEWEAIGLVQAKKEVPSSYVDHFYEHIDDQIIWGLNTKRIKITDIERLTIAAVAIGKNPRDINGYDLIELIYNSPTHISGTDTMILQGNNGPIFALIALDTLDFDVPDDAKWTREDLIEELLDQQNDDGSWPLNDTYPNPNIDITAMAIIALSQYKNKSEVDEAIQKAIHYLSDNQTNNGGFDGGAFVGGITSEAASQAIIGLSAYGLDPTGDLFTKENNLIEHLLNYQQEDGGFAHTMEDGNSNDMATEQALQALVAYKFFLEGKGSLYDFTNREEGPDNPEEPIGDENQNSKDRSDQIVINPGEKKTVDVIPDKPIVVNETVKIESSRKFPEGTSVLVSLPVDVPSAEKIAGDIVDIKFHFPDNVDFSNTSYLLTMGIHENVEKDKVAIYYFNEDTQNWEYIGGKVDNNQITATVDHFSTYAVLIDDDAPEKVKLSIKEQTEDQITLEFSAIDFSGIDYFILKRNGQEIAQIPGDQTTYIDEDVNLGETYDYELIAVDFLGNRSESIFLTIKHSILASKDADNEVVGKRLPNTATNMYSFLFIGFVFLIFGLVLFQMYKGKLNHKNNL